MWYALILSATVALAGPAAAKLGSAHPSDSNRSPVIPSPQSTESNSTSWVTPQPEYTDPGADDLLRRRAIFIYKMN
jgi:hypothetical protein